MYNQMKSSQSLVGLNEVIDVSQNLVDSVGNTGLSVGTGSFYVEAVPD